MIRSTTVSAAVATVATLALASCSPTSPSPAPSDGTSSGTVPELTAPAPTTTASATVDAPTVTSPIETVTVGSTETVASDLAAPWDVEFTAAGTALITERDAGRIVAVRDGESTPLTGAGADALASAVDATGEAGLLGIALLPSDPSVLYAYLTRASDNAVLRMSLDGTTLGEPVEVLTGIPKAFNHDGGRIAFGPDGHLYVATGDAAQPELAQDLDSLAGAILRIVADGTDADGDVPDGNPFDSPVWSMGHRNVQGLAWLPDGTFVASEFGQADADELNVITSGANYGWPATEGLLGAPDGAQLGDTVDGITFPVAQWSPTSTASPSGIAATEAGVFVAALRGEALWWVPWRADAGWGEPQVLIDNLGRLRDVSVDAEGHLYVLTNNTDGRGSPAAGDDRLIRVELDVS